MATWKETRAIIIALHRKGFTGKDIAASKNAPKLTIYRIIKNFKERGSIVVKKASVRPRKSSKSQDRVLKLIQLRDLGTTSTELAQEWQQAGECICSHSEAKTFGGWPGVKKGSKEATSLQEKHQGQTDTLQKVQTAEDWGKGIFSDESPFRLFGVSR